jgi:hypothetical protein
LSSARLTLAVGALAVAATTALAGCGASAAPESTSTPKPAPAPDPCALLSSAQLQQMLLNPGQRQPSQDPHTVSGRSCTWNNSPTRQDDVYTAQLLNVPPPDALPTTLDGLSAAVLTPPNTDPRTHCTYTVALGTGYTLEVTYANPSGDITGMNHQDACYSALEGTYDMIETYQEIIQDH